MPKIDTYTRQVAPRGFVKTGNTSGAFGQGISQSTNKVAAVLDNYAQKRATSDYVAQMSAFQLDNARRLQELQNEDFGPDADLSAIFQQDVEARAQALKVSPLLGDRFEADMAGIKLDFVNSGIKEQVRREGVKAKGDWDISKSNGFALISLDHTKGPQVKNNLSALIDNDPRLKPEGKEVAKRQLSVEVEQLVAESMAENAPEEMLSKLEGGYYSGEKKGLDGYFERLAYIESSNNPAAQNPNSSAKGRFQFIDSTAKKYGITAKFGTPEYEKQEIRAVKELTKDNQRGLKSFLGRNPTQGELYLAHQQGLGGAKKMLGNPNQSAVKVLGEAAVLNNGGSEDMTLGQFASKWTNKFAGSDAVLMGETQDQLKKVAFSSIIDRNPAEALQMAEANPGFYGKDNIDAARSAVNNIKTEVEKKVTSDAIVGDVETYKKAAAGEMSLADVEQYPEGRLKNLMRDMVTKKIPKKSNLAMATKHAELREKTLVMGDLFDGDINSASLKQYKKFNDEVIKAASEGLLTAAQTTSFLTMYNEDLLTDVAEGNTAWGGLARGVQSPYRSAFKSINAKLAQEGQEDNIIAKKELVLLFEEFLNADGEYKSSGNTKNDEKKIKEAVNDAYIAYSSRKHPELAFLEGSPNSVSNNIGERTVASETPTAKSDATISVPYKLMKDANGNVARVYEDGRIEEVK